MILDCTAVVYNDNSEFATFACFDCAVPRPCGNRFRESDREGDLVCERDRVLKHGRFSDCV